MPCDVKHTADGGVYIVCSRHTRKWCVYCGADAPTLCDGPGKAPGKTCDKPMCRVCAFHAGPDVDYCRDHRPTT
jgi:hypothetical protein